jgi:hypothetical protein
MADIYVTVAGAGSQTGADKANAYSLADWQTNFSATTAGDTWWIFGGTYTQTAAISTANDGTSDSPIRVIGVKAATTNEPPLESDWAYDDDRPNIVSGANDFLCDNYAKKYNLRGTTADSTGWRMDQNSLFYNCKCQQTAEQAAYPAFLLNDSYGRIIDCEAFGIGTSYARGISASTGAIIKNCFVYDCLDGYYSAGSGQTCISNSIFADCGTGIDMQNDGLFFIDGVTIDDCTTGVDSSTVNANTNVYVNNTFSNCTDALKYNNSDTDKLSEILLYNNFYNNTRDISMDNGTSDNQATMQTIGDTAVNPAFEDAAGDDYRLASGSGLLNTGMPLRVGVG